MPTMMAALVAAALGQRLNTNREWQAFAHTLMVGEYKANVNSLPPLRFLRSGMALRMRLGGDYRGRVGTPMPSATSSATKKNEV
jgi:hypothetical protein